ncbi:MAG TPA: GAF domain-containing protein [Stellaceae bacterium]|nr:GAF domain-containing protein [Stellaceae bacterium]
MKQTKRPAKRAAAKTDKGAGEIARLKKELRASKAASTRLEKKLRACTEEVARSLERQAATGAVLRIIADTKADLQPVMQAIVEHAARLCDTPNISIFRIVDGTLRMEAALGGSVDGPRELAIDVGSGAGRAIVEKRQIHIENVGAALKEFPALAATFARRAWGTTAATPMLREGQAIGVLVAVRPQVSPFSPEELELQTNFAAQAVIAIENARLLAELRESLDRQTATADVLGAISSSPGTLEPVFNAVLDNAMRMCEAKFASVMRIDGEIVEVVATAGMDADVDAFFREKPQPLGALTAVRHMVATRAAVHIPDLREHPSYLSGTPWPAATVERAGARTVLFVPMIRDSDVVGIINVYRQEVRPFTDKQIELVEDFAAQAVIAIENARLLTELRESLDRQTATAEVLGVISSSPGELQPVFETMLENAVRICGADQGRLWRSEDGGFVPLAANGIPTDLVAHRGARIMRPGPHHVLSMMARTGQVIHLPDVFASDAYRERDPDTVAAVEKGNIRLGLAVPLLRDREVIGAFTLNRREPRPFTDKQIELVESFAKQAVIAIENARLLTELRESLDHQTATSAVLSAISASPGAVESVFNVILENALRISSAKMGAVGLCEGKGVRVEAIAGYPSGLRERAIELARNPGPESAVGRVLVTRQTQQFQDAQATEAYARGDSLTRFGVAFGAASVLCVPMLRDKELIGTILLIREEPRAFSEKQVALVESFAAQAVIAIENARLLTELRESLDRQTATSEVLGVISASPGELQPVFDTMLGNAVRICEATQGAMWQVDGDLLRLAAQRGMAPELMALRPHGYQHPPDSLPQQMRRTKRTIHIADLDAYVATRDEPATAEVVRLAGARSTLLVPLLKDGEVIGGLTLQRREAKAFTDKQIELVENFAAQAVIAIENARLLGELRESLDRQTATADILRVIASTPGDPTRALDTIAETAARMFDAWSVGIRRLDGTVLRSVSAAGPLSIAHRNQLPDLVLDQAPIIGSAVVENRQVHIEDFAARTDETSEASRRLALEMGVRTTAFTPLTRDGKAIGVMAVNRNHVRPFLPNELELMRGFADQAVIAIENARLLTELRESLDRQTATSEVLGVISSSPGELQPVFDTMVENAVRLCEGAEGSIFQLSGNVMVRMASRGMASELAARREVPIAPGSLSEHVLRTKTSTHLPDVAALLKERPDAEHIRFSYERGARSTLMAPLLKDGEVIGCFVVNRREVRPFTAKQIELVENFAKQAVIAIENARLLSELRQRTDELTESLEQQTAMSDVLGVISASPGDIGPVFKTMLANAIRICDAGYGVLARYLGEGVMTGTVMQGVPPAFAAYLEREPSALAPAALRTPDSLRRTVHVLDAREDDAYRKERNELRVAAVELGGARTMLRVPLVKDDAQIGGFILYRQEVRPFTAKQIELVENFAAQAVIAIENARLLTELRESLDRQTATAEVLGVISSSPGVLQPVFDTMLESAIRICDAGMGVLYRRDGDALNTVAQHGAMGVAGMERDLRPHPQSDFARMIATKATVHTPDLKTSPEYRLGVPGPVRLVDQVGVRAVLHVPLMREGELIGVFNVYRREPRPFTDKQIELVENFAAQAVIAIENARLLTELRESLEQQTATADVLKVISRSTFDLQAVLDTLVTSAAHLCRADRSAIRLARDDVYRHAASHGFTPEQKDYMKDHALLPSRGSVAGRVVLEGKAVQVSDTKADPEYRLTTGPVFADVRTTLGVPLLRENVPIGVLILTRAAIEPFTDKQIELVTTFADQAVIAIENARLLTELRQRTDELAQRQAELRVTFDNMGDGVAMFDAALRLAAWNRNLQQILDIPDEFFAAPRTYRDYIAYLIERGEFGDVDIEAELRRYVETTGQERRVERTRPDGRVLEVRVNPVPGGGFVAIYGDITERKRAEEQVRAARDAAEKTLGELKTAQASLIQAEKMASLGQLTAGIAHEIKNPLNFVNNFAGLSVELLDELKQAAAPALDSLDEDARGDIDGVVAMLTGNLEKIAEHGRRADGIVKSMLAHSRGGSGERQSVNINALVEESLNLAYHGARAQDQNFNITLERDFDSSIAPLEVVPQDITRVFLNLFGNGFYAANKRRARADDPSFRPVLKVTIRDQDGEVAIRIRDNGIGISPDIRAKLFEPFFTTKPTGEGTGLGLSISYEIVTQQHGGTIEVESEVGAFTEFTVRLPRRFGAAANA